MIGAPCLTGMGWIPRDANTCVGPDHCPSPLPDVDQDQAHAMALTQTVDIDLPVEMVFDFVADARNDPQWCPRVRWCKQINGDGPLVGARYEAFEKPSFRKPQSRWIDLITCERPTRVVTRQVDDKASSRSNTRWRPTVLAPG
jgi:hypothetical protein